MAVGTTGPMGRNVERSKRMKIAWTLIVLATTTTPLFGQARNTLRQLNSESQTSRRTSTSSTQINPALLKKLRPLYPGVRLQRGASGEPFFFKVEEVARVRLKHGRERLVVRVGVTVPAARVDHGWGGC